MVNVRERKARGTESTRRTDSVGDDQRVLDSREYQKSNENRECMHNYYESAKWRVQKKIKCAGEQGVQKIQENRGCGRTEGVGEERVRENRGCGRTEGAGEQRVRGCGITEGAGGWRV